MRCVSLSFIGNNLDPTGKGPDLDYSNEALVKDNAFVLQLIIAPSSLLSGDLTGSPSKCTFL